MYEQILSGVASAFGGSGGGGGGGSAVPGSTGAKSGGVTTYIQPGGINLGAILQPLNEGNSATGGYDINLLSRLGYGRGGNSSTLTMPGASIDFSNPVTWGIAAAGLGILLLLAKKGR